MDQYWENVYECKVQKIRLAAFSRYGTEVIDHQQFRELFGESGELDKDKDHWIFKHCGCFTRGHTKSCTDPFRWRLNWRKAGENIESHTVFFLDKDITDELIKKNFKSMEVSREYFRENFVKESVQKLLSAVKK